MKKAKLVLMMFLAVALLLAACGGGGGNTGGSSGGNTGGSSGGNTGGNTGGGSNKTYTIKVSHTVAPGGHFSVFVQKWAELAAERSNGALVIEEYPAGQLGNEREGLEGTMMGTIEAAMVGTTMPIYDERWFALDLPFLFASKEEARAKVNGEFGDALFATLAEHNLVGLAWPENGLRQITTSVRPITKPEDLQGLRIRLPENKMYVQTFQLLGANPQAIAFTELFSALESGVVDGQENPLPLIHSSQFYEVQKYLTMTNHFYNTPYLLMNLDFYNSLPEDLQKIVKETAREATEFQYKYNDEQEEAIIKDLEAHGMQVIREIDVEPFRQKVAPVWEEIRKTIGDELYNLATK